jgi:phosphoenolpyruvate---glycerone phosphotransferase subunit DhaM
VTVGLVIVSHSAKLAAGVVELAGQMAPDVPIHPAGGLPDGSLGTDYPLVAAAAEAADTGAGVVLLYDLGSARMTAELVGEAAEHPERVKLAEAPLVEGAVAAAVAAAGGADLAGVLAAAAGAPFAEAAESGPSGPRQRLELVLTNEVGLHARPAAILARSVAGLDVEITVRVGAQEADARSVLALLGLAARKGDKLEITARGPDAAAALDNIQQAVHEFG